MRPDVEESDKHCRKESKIYFKQEDWKGWKLTFFEQILKNHKLIQKFTLKIEKANSNLNQNSFRSRACTLYEHALYGTRKEGKRGRGYTGGGGGYRDIVIAD
jgi:hypothetical protein